MATERRTACQEYGHEYDSCGCVFDTCKMRFCIDCGDEYEDE